MLKKPALEYVKRYEAAHGAGSRSLFGASTWTAFEWLQHAVPQALKTIRSRDTRGISLAMYVVFTIGVACWFGYGIALGSWPMILSNVVTFALAATILGLKLKHG